MNFISEILLLIYQHPHSIPPLFKMLDQRYSHENGITNYTDFQVQSISQSAVTSVDNNWKTKFHLLHPIEFLHDF
jgi:hypothetical protein